MKKFLFLILTAFSCVACKKEDVTEPLSQLHFIEFVGEDGHNLIASNKLEPADIFYVAGQNSISWNELIAEKQQIADQVIASTPQSYAYTDTLTSMLNSQYLLLEESSGNLNRDREISINGVKTNWKFSLKDGFFRDGKAVQVKSAVIDKQYVYLHQILVEGL